MQQMIRINGIERKAALYNVTLSDLCQRAKVHPSTVFRWKNGDTVPREQIFEKIAKALEDELAKIHAEMIKIITLQDETPPHPPPIAPAAA